MRAEEYEAEIIRLNQVVKDNLRDFKALNELPNWLTLPTEDEIQSWRSGGYSSHPDDCVTEGAEMVLDWIKENNQ